MPYYIEDPELGKIFIHVNARAKHIIARKKDEQVHLTIPTYSQENDIRKALAEMKPKLVTLKSASRKMIDEKFELHTYSFDVNLSRNQLSKIYLNLKDGILQITVPQSVDVYQNSIQEQLQKLIESALRFEAKRILPDYVKRLALQHNFHFKEVKINKSTTRWGSCNSQGAINLSYFCLLLPHHLLNLIVLHELCHTREMNHSERFWQLLDTVTENQAKKLTKELKKISPTI